MDPSTPRMYYGHMQVCLWSVAGLRVQNSRAGPKKIENRARAERKLAREESNTVFLSIRRG